MSRVENSERRTGPSYYFGREINKVPGVRDHQVFQANPEAHVSKTFERSWLNDRLRVQVNLTPPTGKQAPTLGIFSYDGDYFREAGVWLAMRPVQQDNYLPFAKYMQKKLFPSKQPSSLRKNPAVAVWAARNQDGSITLRVWKNRRAQINLSQWETAGIWQTQKRLQEFKINQPEQFNLALASYSQLPPNTTTHLNLVKQTNIDHLTSNGDQLEPCHALATVSLSF